MCEAVADAMGATLHPPAQLEQAHISRFSPIASAITDNLRLHVLPELDAEWSKSQLAQSCMLVNCLDRVINFGSSVDECDLDELRPLLGHRPVSLQQGLHDLDVLIATGRGAGDAEILSYLARRAYRAEQLYTPVVAGLFPGRHFVALDF
jgi:hypothetical protein